MVLNMKYEYQDGRLSAIGLVGAAIDKFPTELLDEHSQLLYLPTVLQLVNDESKKCREAASSCVLKLLRRVSTSVVKTLFEYTKRWSNGAAHLQRTAIQVFGMFIDADLDMLKERGVKSWLCEFLTSVLDEADETSWEVPYFALICLEKMAKHNAASTSSGSDRSGLLNDLALWEGILVAINHDHPWIKLASSRLVGLALVGPIDPTTDLRKIGPMDLFLVQRRGFLFDLAQGFCRQIALDESEGDNTELVSLLVKNLSWVGRAMKANPDLCFKDDMPPEDDNENENDSNDAVDEKDNAQDRANTDQAQQERKRDPLRWLFTRLSHMAKPKIAPRREAVFKCIAGFAHIGGGPLVGPYLETLLEPLHRSVLESEGRKDAEGNTIESDEATLARDVTQLLEECAGDDFMEAYAAVKSKARDKRDKRKEAIATEAMVDPKAASLRKIKKHQQERNRRKRRVDERRSSHGRTQKRRHYTQKKEW